MTDLSFTMKIHNENKSEIEMEIKDGQVKSYTVEGQEKIVVESDDDPSEPKDTFVTKFKANLGENLLLLATVLAVIVGISLAFILRAACGEGYFNKNEIQYFNFMGDLFLRMLKFLILPLIGSSLICGIAGLGSTNGGKIAARAIVYYFASTFCAVVIGILLVISIRPGVGKDANVETDIEIDTSKHVTTYDTMLDLIRNLFPDNIVEMAFTQYSTVSVPEFKWFIDLGNGSNYTIAKLPNDFLNGTNGTAIQVLDYYRATASKVSGLNVLGLILFCFVFGGVLASMGEQARVMIQFFDVLNEASIRMIKLVMMISPLGICSLILATILEMNNPAEVFASISMYMVTVLLGLFVHGCIFLPLVYWLITRNNVWTYTKNVMEALLIALATASSTAALPTTLRCSEEKNKINKNISRFVLPVGATINMNGTALYEAIAVIFIAQLNGRTLGFVDLLLASLTATLASIGAASVPSAGLVTMIIILSALDLPPESISLIYTVDWFLDRLRTTINVWGDALGAGIVNHLSRKEIENLEKDEESDVHDVASVDEYIEKL